MYKIRELKSPTRFLVVKHHWLFPFVSSPCTYGDGCGNDTGIEVVFDTRVEAEEYIKRAENLKEWLRKL